MGKSDTGVVVGQALSVECVRDGSTLKRLEPDWRLLSSAADGASMFTDWEWAQAWLEVFASPVARLNVLVVREGEEVVGVAPFIITRQSVPGLGPLSFRVLRFVATGEPEADEVATEYPDILTRPGREESVALAVADWLLGQQRSDWDIAWFDNLLETSVTMRWLVPVLEAHGRGAKTRPVGWRYWIALPDSWEAYLATLSKSFRNKILTSRRRLERAANVEVETIRDTTQRIAGLARLGALHTSRWTSKGRSGVFSSERFERFHRDFVARPFAQEGPVLWFVRLDGRDLAALYNIERDGVVYFYQSGLDAARAGNLSPGVAAMSFAIEDAIRSGRRVFDFMKGGEESYKASYGCRRTRMLETAVANRTTRGTIAKLVWAVRRSSDRRADEPAGSGQT